MKHGAYPFDPDKLYDSAIGDGVLCEEYRPRDPDGRVYLRNWVLMGDGDYCEGFSWSSILEPPLVAVSDGD